VQRVSPFKTLHALCVSKPRKHIRGVRLHFLPESEKGKPELYQDMKYEKMK
jgi:hypothetical protein